MHKDQLKALVGAGETGKALEELLEYADSRNFPNLASAVHLLQARLSKWEKDNSLGLLDYRDATTTRNQINAAVLELLENDLEKDLPKKDLKELEGKSAGGKTIAWGLPFTLLVILLIAWVLKSSDKAFSVTVFVHGKEGRHQRILQNQGKVVLQIGTATRKESISENGEATFKDIAADFKGKTALITIEHPQPYQSTHPDSAFVLQPNASIYLEAALQGTDRIFGKVFDLASGQPLDSVRVSIRKAFTFTDEHGDFELEIPGDLQAKFQKVAFEKPGYKFLARDSIPVHTKQAVEVGLEKAN